jgi:hypothetical protein
MYFHTERPIYAQLSDEIRRQIAAGRLLPGAKIGSIRELALFTRSIPILFNGRWPNWNGTVCSPRGGQAAKQ